jgi:hypothetical protein
MRRITPMSRIDPNLIEFRASPETLLHFFVLHIVSVFGICARSNPPHPFNQPHPLRQPA